MSSCRRSRPFRLRRRSSRVPESSEPAAASGSSTYRIAKHSSSFPTRSAGGNSRSGASTKPARGREREALSAAEIAEMAGLVDFQSHTVTHPILPSCSADAARREIAESKHDLEREYRLDIYAFSYPNGDYSDRDAEIAKQSGYACAIIVDAGFNTRRTDPFRLKRIIVEDDDSTDVVIVRTSGLWAALARVVRRKPYGRKPVQDEDS